MASGSRQQSQGRLTVHDRETDSHTAILGQNVQISESHMNSILTSTRFEMKDSCRRDYRSRINRIVKWLLANYPDYHDVGVRVLTAEDLTDPTQFHHKNDCDLIYSGFNVQIFLSFLSDKKINDKFPLSINFLSFK